MRRVVAQLSPKLFIAEECCDGLSQNFGGTYLKRIATDFAALGYSVEHRVIDAVAYGVPQHRRRIIFVGTRAELGIEFEWPKPTHLAPARNGEFRIAESQRSDPSILTPFTLHNPAPFAMLSET